MAKATKETVTKRLELSREASSRLEERADLCGMTQAALVQDLVMCGKVAPTDSTMVGAKLLEVTEQAAAVDEVVLARLEIAEEAVSSLGDEVVRLKRRSDDLEVLLRDAALVVAVQRPGSGLDQRIRRLLQLMDSEGARS